MANCNYKVNIKDIQSKYSFKIFCAGDNAEVKAEIGNLEDLTTTAKNNLVSAINEVHSDTETNATAISGLQSSKEDKSNKVTSFSSASTDTQYPSAKAVYDSQVTQNETISTLENNLEETQAELDYYKTIYNVLPKVSGNGESITLNDTGESILKLSPRGQCKQYSTTGKNILPNGVTSTTLLDVKITRNDDGSIKLNGTASGQGNLTIGEVSFTNGETYTISGVTDFTDTTLQIYTSSTNAFPSGSRLQCYDGAVTRTAQADENCSVKLYIYGGVTYNNVTIYPMIVKGSTSGEYEPYTGGQPSPSPDYPQQIHEVSGDNEDLVRNIQLWDEELEYGGYNLTTGEKNNTNYYRSANYILITPNTNMMFMKPVGKYTRVLFYDINKNFISAPDVIYTNYLNTQFTSPENAYYMTFSLDYINATYNNDIMVYYGNTVHDYEPYNGDTYELDLGVENLCDISSLTTKEVYGLTITRTNDEISITGTRNETGWASIIDFTLPIGTYTFSFVTSGTMPREPKVLKGYDQQSNTFSVSDTTQTYRIAIGGSVNDEWNCILKLQIEEGTKANSYSPFGQTPIKMRGIGTYEDYFVRNSGKNLFDESVAINNCSVSNGFITITSNTTDVYIQGAYVYSEANKFLTLPSGNYYLKSTNSNVRITLYGDNGNLDTTNSQPITLASETNFGGIRIRSSSSLQNVSFGIMLSTEDTMFEPYGTGQWCKYNAIGKKVFVGTEIWDYSSTTSSFATYNPFEIVNKTDYSTQTKLPEVIANYYTPITWQSLTGGGTGIAMLYASSTLQLRLSSSETTSENFKTWLSTHNVEVLYPLQNPYLSLIENETLISQLDKVEKALAKSGQTNISQVNNDIPFKIYATALKEISGE